MQKKNYDIDSILTNLNIKALNPMQEAALEHSGVDDDVILLSATGSGKTLAFLLPILELLDFDNKLTTQALIVVPSRELALQIEQVFRSMGTGLKITCCYGGHLRETEENNLVQPPAVIVGTPGRLCDHIRRTNITVDSIHTLVLDEFDKCLDLGFQEEVEFIIDSLPNINKRILTSATRPEEIPDFVGLNEPTTLDFLTGEEAKEVRLEVKQVLSDDRDKLDTLFRLLCILNRSTIVFCNHREAVERTSAYLTEKGINNEFYHGAMEQRERDSALCKYRNGSTNILITTDLAARGLDIPFIRYIVHYHLPHTEDSFTHRNGRTARMESSGTAILLLGPDEKLPSYVDEDIETIEVPENPSLPDRPKWATLFIAAGKKDKVNKVDIVGFLSNKAELKKEDIGLIEVKDFFSFVAVRRQSVNFILTKIKDQKIKNKKVKIDLAR